MSLEKRRRLKGGLTSRSRYVYYCPLGCYAASGGKRGLFLVERAVIDHLMACHTKQDLAEAIPLISSCGEVRSVRWLRKQGWMG